MKIGLTICEYNPFHNGHYYSLTQIKEQLNPDLTVVIMSGNFTQRGETAIIHKYARAKHAVLAGADVVFELPTVFATAPAEIFAKGAVKLLNSLKGEKTLCFGVESGDKNSLLKTAQILSSESEKFKIVMKELLDQGYSHAKSRALAVERLNAEGLEINYLSSPNNVLALEYTKAIIQNQCDMDILPILRKGAGYKDLSQDQNLLSAMGIRTLINENKKEELKPFVPSFVFDDLPNRLPCADQLILSSLLTSESKKLAQILDCTEGLENRIKEMAKTCFSRQELIDKVTTKRYTSTRISRIILSSLLGITNSTVKNCLNSNLYLKVLAINEDKLSCLSSIIGKTPVIMRKSDTLKLKNKWAKKCFELDVLANDIYNQITKTKTNEYYTQIIKK